MNDKALNAALVAVTLALSAIAMAVLWKIHQATGVYAGRLVFGEGINAALSRFPAWLATAANFLLFVSAVAQSFALRQLPVKERVAATVAIALPAVWVGLTLVDVDPRISSQSPLAESLTLNQGRGSLLALIGNSQPDVSAPLVWWGIALIALTLREQLIAAADRTYAELRRLWTHLDETGTLDKTRDALGTGAEATASFVGGRLSGAAEAVGFNGLIGWILLVVGVAVLMSYFNTPPRSAFIWGIVLFSALSATRFSPMNGLLGLIVGLVKGGNRGPVKKLKPEQVAALSPSERRAYLASLKNTEDASATIDQTDMLADPMATMNVPKVLNNAQTGVFAGKLRTDELFASFEDRACIIGPPGTGKTAFLIHQLLTWADTRRSFVCLDIKPEIYGITRARLESKGYRVLAFNPTELGTWRYNPLADLDGPESVGELVSNLIADSGAENAVFFESARDLCDAVITHLLEESRGAVALPDVRDYISQFSDGEAMLSALRASPSAQCRAIASELNMIAANERLFGSVIASLRAGLKFLRFPAISNALSASDFSLSELCSSDKPVALFLQFEEGKADVLQRLTALMVGHVLRYFIDHTDRPEVLFLLDEIGNAKGITGLTSKLNTIRSRRMPVWMYWQSVAQMALYGDKQTGANGRDLIFGACDFVGVFRLNDNDTATYVSEAIGTVHRVVSSHGTGSNTSESSGSGGSSTSYSATGIHGSSSSSGGSFTAASATNLAKSLTEEAVIKPHQLRELAAGQMVCWYRGEAWRGTAEPYYRKWPEYQGKRPDLSDTKPDRPRSVDPEPTSTPPAPAAPAAAVPAPSAALAKLNAFVQQVEAKPEDEQPPEGVVALPKAGQRTQGADERSGTDD